MAFANLVSQFSPMDAAATKAILEHFPYGLYVVTVTHDGEEHGMTANWITQASFEPPMLAVAIENSSRTIGLIRDAHHFAVSLLTTEQRDLAGKLGRSSEQAPQKLRGVKTKPAPVAQTPVLTDAVGWVECRAVASLPAGDHTLVLGEILAAGVENGDAVPLTLSEAGMKYS
jgi:flavin reductase (DIM6/NTAB) family NADH-FMN oxidoreductase RutF